MTGDGGAPTATAEFVDIVPTRSPLARWDPIVGEETLSLLRNLRLPNDDGSARQRLLEEAVAPLSRCLPPTDPDGRETGLVIGYVQSGKTTNFTAVTALSKDNGYGLVIVCTGVTVNLFNQSSGRLRSDLRIDERTDRQWLFLENPRSEPNVEQMIETALDSRRTVLISVMKNGRHLDNLRRLLARLPLHGVPALVIDDEADQASLNNLVRSGNETPTYRRILDLRDLLPHHTFLQYTATPQALLLINLIDLLSPGFAQVLTPGPLYTGGREFFERDMALIREIPAQDIPSQANPIMGAPPSLLEALRLFWIGVAAGLLIDRGAGNRSMMVHPSQRTPPHADYHQWVIQVQRLWAETLAAGDGDPDYIALVDQFRRSQADLAATVQALPEFEEIVPRLRDAIRQTIVTQVNAARGRTPQPDWRQFYAHVVVGGEVLNRGVTLAGLTVSYMPRGPGTGQADTIQQRARWFGYKAEYLGYCRVYLSGQMIRLYRAYVDHEAALRTQLRNHQANGRELREWRRAFFLDPQLRPTRASVIDLEPLRGSFSDEWFIPRAPHEPQEASRSNRDIVSRFVERLDDEWRLDTGSPRRTSMQIHNVTAVPLRQAYEDLLTHLRLGRPGDSAQLTGLLLQVGRYMETNPDATCVVYRMSQGVVRNRDLDGAGEIPTLFQGANYDDSVSPRITLYPGDREIRDSEQLTIQLHTVRVRMASGTVVAEDVPVVTVWVPAVMGHAWVSQPPPP